MRWEQCISLIFDPDLAGCIAQGHMAMSPWVNNVRSVGTSCGVFLRINLWLQLKLIINRQNNRLICACIGHVVCPCRIIASGFCYRCNSTWHCTACRIPGTEPCPHWGRESVCVGRSAWNITLADISGVPTSLPHCGQSSCRYHHRPDRVQPF